MKKYITVTVAPYDINANVGDALAISSVRIGGLNKEIALTWYEDESTDPIQADIIKDDINHILDACNHGKYEELVYDEDGNKTRTESLF